MCFRDGGLWVFDSIDATGGLRTWETAGGGELEVDRFGEETRGKLPLFQPK